MISVFKTNFGHLDAAAGVTGLIKTALALKHKVIGQNRNHYLSFGFQGGVVQNDISLATPINTNVNNMPNRKDEIENDFFIKVDDIFYMCVLPACCKIDLDALRQQIGAKHVKLADENEMAKLFPDCALGAEPPFGGMYGFTDGPPIFSTNKPLVASA